jgi:hypothetical protein
MKPMLPEFGQCGELFHTPSGTAFADIPVKDHQETWPIRSKRFRSWLRRGYYEATGEAASVAAVRSALDHLEARAQFDGPERAVHIRIAEYGEQVYLDLADEHWRAVEIGADGWQVIGSPPVRFPPETGSKRTPPCVESASAPSSASLAPSTGPSGNRTGIKVAHEPCARQFGDACLDLQRRDNGADPPPL